jgi:hypothetical protein
MRKMNYLYANVRSMCQATMLPEPGGAAPYVLKQTSDEGVFAAGLFKPGSPGDGEAMGVWRAGFWEIGSNSDGIPSRAKRRCLGAG